MGFDLHPVNPNTELAIAAGGDGGSNRSCMQARRPCQDMSIDRRSTDPRHDVMWNAAAAAGTLKQSGYSLMIMSGMDVMRFLVHVALELPVVTRYACLAVVIDSQ